jgi:hypothetical protein
MIAARSFGSIAIAMTIALGCALGCNTTEVRTTGNGPIVFSAGEAAPPEGASIVLRSRPLVPLDRVVVDVVARGAPDLHGAAFRVTWDPATLVFAEAQSAPVWSKQLVALATEGTPGQLAVVWTEKGEKSLDATAETVLGTLTFDVRGRKSTTLAFVEQRAQVVDRRGVAVPMTWRGGTVSAR